MLTKCELVRFTEVAWPAGLGFPPYPSIQLLYVEWSLWISHTISLNLIEFAPSCGRLMRLMHGGSLSVISFLFACFYGA